MANNTTDHPWSQVFRNWCASTGKTQVQIAEHIGVTQSIISAWSNGKRIPSGKWQQTIARLTHNMVPTMIGGYKRGLGLGTTNTQEVNNG